MIQLNGATYSSDKYNTSCSNINSNAIFVVHTYIISYLIEMTRKHQKKILQF